MEFKEELIKYCEQDVKSLYQVIDTLVNIFLMAFRVDILNILHVPSLALAIYRTHYLRTIKFL